MPLVHFLYRCPHCGHDPLSGVGDEARCVSCGTVYERGGEGGKIRVRRASGAFSEESGRALGRLVDLRAEATSDRDAENPLRRAEVVFRYSDGESPVRFGGELVGFAEHLGEGRSGVLELTKEALLLWVPVPVSPKEFPEEPFARWDLLGIGAIQTSSTAVQIAPHFGGLVHFKFTGDSPYRWEGLLQGAIRGAFRREGRGEILEFQPRIVVGRRATEEVGGVAEKRAGGLEGGGDDEGYAPLGMGKSTSPEPLFSWYAFLRMVAKGLVALGVRMEVEGLENIPASGPFFLVGNHQSVLDPILAQGACPRPVHTFTKSTQFSGSFFRWLTTRVNGIPTRRYRIDPQVVRIALRRLSEGKGVGVYPEGERSWDGTLQPFRQGTIRLLLKAGVPVVPCGISGSYDVWPRWSRKIKRRRAVLRFGEPIRWPAMHDRRERDASLPGATETLKRALIQLGAWEKTEVGEEGGA
jgi:1-acyl-sn-glycerol-3-phosphate acyltransferase